MLLLDISADHCPLEEDLHPGPIPRRGSLLAEAERPGSGPRPARGGQRLRVTNSEEARLSGGRS